MPRFGKSARMGAALFAPPLGAARLSAEMELIASVVQPYGRPRRGCVDGRNTTAP